MEEKKGGEEVGFGRVKEEKGREGWRERKSTPGSSSQKGKKELQRNGLLAGALAPSNRNRACDSEVTYTANLCKGWIKQLFFTFLFYATFIKSVPLL